MSAAPSFAQARRPRPAGNWTRTPSQLYRTAQELPLTKTAILFVVDRLTNGLHKQWTTIKPKYFRCYMEVTRSFIYETTAELVKDGLLLQNPKNSREYRLAFEVVFHKPKLTQCNDCHRVAERRPVTGFEPTLHSLLNIFAACSHALVKVILAMVPQLFDLDIETGKSAQIGEGRRGRKAKLGWISADFEGRTGLSEGSVSQALIDGEKLGIILREPDPDLKHPNRSLYTIDLDALDRLPRRAKRKCDQPKRRRQFARELEIVSGAASVLSGGKRWDFDAIKDERAAMEVIKKSPEVSEKIDPLDGFELTGGITYGQCADCLQYGLGKDVVAIKPQSEASRAGPAGPGPPQALKNRPKEEIPEHLKGVHAFMARWCTGLSVLPTAQQAQDFLDGMQGCSFEWVEQRFRVRDVVRIAKSPGLLVKMVREDAGPSWIDRQKRGIDPAALKASEERFGFTVETLQNYLSVNAQAVAAAGFGEIAKTVARLAADIKQYFSDTDGIEALEKQLVVLEGEMFAALKLALTAEQLLSERKALDADLRPYRGKMSADQLLMLENQYLEKRLLEANALPRLSIFYMR
jgi:hypothetical protein